MIMFLIISLRSWVRFTGDVVKRGRETLPGGGLNMTLISADIFKSPTMMTINPHNILLALIELPKETLLGMSIIKSPKPSEFLPPMRRRRDCGLGGGIFCCTSLLDGVIFVLLEGVLSLAVLEEALLLGTMMRIQSTRKVKGEVA